MLRLYWWLVEAKVADDMIDFNNDVLGNPGFHRSAIDHLCEVDALLVWLTCESADLVY